MKSSALIHHTSQISRLVGLAAVVLAASQVHAAGFYLQETGAPHSPGTAGVAYSHGTGKGSGYSLGMSYERSPVDDQDRTFDLPFDEIVKLSAGYFWQGDRHLDFAIGGTLYLIDDASIDQTSQGVRAKGESDENVILFLGGRLRYVF
ncbi:MAG: hypothetical protein PVJ03_02875 [Chromatiaceae bacterium]|jgi:hypothetical protein